jgi:hypothetical protein
VNPPKDGSKPNLALRIPSPPVERVERRLPDGRWVDARAYQEALAKLSDEDALTTAQVDAAGADVAGGAFTVRIYLADWVREQIVTVSHRGITAGGARLDLLQPAADRREQLVGRGHVRPLAGHRADGMGPQGDEEPARAELVDVDRQDQRPGPPRRHRFVLR